MIPITQTKSWQHLQEDLNEQSFYEQGTGYSYLAIHKRTPVGSYLYLPYGPVAEDQKSFDKALKSLESLAKSVNAIFIRIEPQNRELQLPNSAKKVKNLSPEATWILDLTPDKSEILTHFSQGTRTRYNTYAKKGIVVEKTKDLDQIQRLVDLQAKLFKTKHLTTYGEDYLKTELKQPFATLYLAKYVKENDQTDNQNPPEDGQILAASLFFDNILDADAQGGQSNAHPGARPVSTRYYMQSAADPDFKKLPATVALLTTAIFDAKEQGIEHFDFWGIAPDGADQSHPWYGFTEFKKSFGGRPVHYHGTYDLIMRPFRYKLFQALHHLKYGK